MPNLSALSNITTRATALSNLVLVTPDANKGYQPQNPPDPSGKPSTAKPPPAFLFHYEGEQVLTLESDITDHYVESNIAIQDQIALRPQMFSTQGFIGELNNVAPDFLKPVQFIADKLTTLTAYAPGLSQTALNAYGQAMLGYQVAANAANSAVSAWNSLTGGGETQTKQQIAFAQFKGYWQSRTLFTIQTPWCMMENMAIQRIRAVQDAETRVISTFSIDFKMIQTASTLTVGDKSLSGRLNSQASSLTNLGPSSPQSSTSLSSGLASTLQGG